MTKADFVACHNSAYLNLYDMVEDIKPGGTFLLDCPWKPEELDARLPAKVKKYIAENNINFYIIDGTGISTNRIGNSKVKNTVLQSAFFSLANILPKEEAIEYMKKMAYKSYIKKGEAIVELNYKAIDVGSDAYIKVDVPESWKKATPEEPKPAFKSARPELDEFVNNIVKPTNAMKGDSLPVSAFLKYADGTFPQGSAAAEKRGVAVNVPEWNNEKCIQCNQCSFVCPHATIRPFAMSGEEAAAAPAATNFVKKMIGKGCDNLKFTIAISPLDCMGCALCVKQCPVGALEMKPRESQMDQQPVFDYAVANVKEKELPFAPTTVKGSQFKQPLLEFSGSCAGCAETSYARLITQLFGERMYISNATGCSSIWGGSAPAMPYTVNKETGRGPAWANSLFEDNAEHGYGIYLAQRYRREALAEKIKKLAAVDYATEEIKTACLEWLEVKEDAKKCTAASEKLLAACRDGIDVDLTGTQWEAEWIKNGKKCPCEACTLAREIIENADLLNKKTVWIFGGDGWAYDIGFGGLDHVIATGENVNIMVFDTEVYSNTGGQASKASQMGQVAQFAAAGKSIGKKSLAEIAMTYGYVYVAQIAMGADMNQTIKALVEAEAYDGPSLIIGYAPCEMHGLKGGMTNCQLEMKRAVECGYWQLFRFNPALKAEGKNPLIIDSRADRRLYRIHQERTRYSRLLQSFRNAQKSSSQKLSASPARSTHISSVLPSFIRLNKQYRSSTAKNIALVLYPARMDKPPPPAGF